MKNLKSFLSAVSAIAAWLFVGLIASTFVSASAATIIGFGAFIVVARYTYPSNSPEAK